MSPKNHDGFTYRQRGPRVNSIASRLRVAAVVHSFDRRVQIFLPRRARAIDTIVQIAPDVVVTVCHDAIHGGEEGSR
jgi:hypothetical protein